MLNLIKFFLVIFILYVIFVHINNTDCTVETVQFEDIIFRTEYIDGNVISYYTLKDANGLYYRNVNSFFKDSAFEIQSRIQTGMKDSVYTIRVSKDPIPNIICILSAEKN